MSEQAVIEKAQAAVGTADTIVAGAWFQPRGTSTGMVGGGALGGGLGHALGGGLGGAIGDLAGAAVAMEAEKHTKAFGVGSGDGVTVHQVPWRSIVAVSETRIYGWRVQLDGVHQSPTDLLFAFDRADITVTVHSRAAVRTFEVEHMATNEKWEFEAERMGSHLKDLLGALDQVDAAAR